MKVLFSFLISLFISICTIASEPIASITLSDPIEENKISLFVNNNSSAEAYTTLTTAGGQECLYIPDGKYAYFRVDDATITENDHDLIFKITYLDEGYGTLAFQYNAIGNELSDKYRRQSFKKTGSDTWITTTISVSDASFRNLQNNNSDFRINKNNYIRRIEIYKGSLDPELEEVPVTSGSEYSEFKGKAVAGYQIWFVASQTNGGWVHWSNNSRPEPGNSSFEVYPDVREYAPRALAQTGFANLGNGENSEVFTSALVIDKHFEWMKDAGIDGVAVQRFIGDAPYPISESDSTHLVKVKKAAEENEKIFYICYDMSSGNDENAWVQSIKFDWVYNIEQNNELTSSPAYATVDNKPVVQVWGPGFTSRVGNAAGTIELIEFLQSRGCYVIGGVPTHWRNEDRDSKPNFLSAYKAYDMVSPWTPGRYSGIAQVDNFKNNNILPDKSFCDANGLDYMPVLFPGFAWSTWNNGTPNHIPREAGNFLWRQAYNIKNTGCTEMYFAMFDEYDEGTAIMKAATDWSMIPTDYYFLTLSADGTWLSSDYYLRVAGAATAMLKSSETPSGTVSIAHSTGPVYYRNSFESRFTTWERNGVKGEGYQKLDPCFYKDAQLINSNISNPVCQIEMDNTNAKSGDFMVKFSGTHTTEGSAAYAYKISEVKIPVTDQLVLSFWKKTLDELGKYVSIDLYFESGKKLSQLPAYKDQNNVAMSPGLARGNIGDDYEHFMSLIGTGELIGDEITGIGLAYEGASTTGSYNAIIDDILLSTDIELIPTSISEQLSESADRIRVEGRVLDFSDFDQGTSVSVFDLSARLIRSFKLTTNRVRVNIREGIYIVSTKSDKGIYSQKVIIRN